MSYIVFARKYRPLSFDDIVGQSHITTTLKNAISQDRVAHAYIFSGPRGVGKTTTARILAKALNCDKGPTVKPCNSCASCKEISQGASMDILEIDGASNRGIDEIRNLRENVKFSPSKGRFKIYIIDEVHMLTQEAFNALLKTLEEPPPHVKFIFATTQAHKVPATILSRCQRFDFRRIATKKIFDGLKNITSSEKLGIDDESLGIIARQADGSMRDGQVLLDQITSFGQGKISAKDVTDILGLVGDEILFGLSKAIKARDSIGALKIVDTLMAEGKDITQVVLGLIGHFRNIAVAKIGKDADSLIDASSDKVERYKKESEKISVEEILYCIYTFSNTIDFIRKTSLARIPLEAALVKLTQVGSIVPLADMMDRIDNIGKRPVLSPVSEPEKTVPVKRPIHDEGKKEEASHPQPPPKTAELEEILNGWTSVINYIKTKKISIASYLQEGYPVSINSNSLAIGFPKECQFHKDVLESSENQKLIADAIKLMFNLELRIKFTIVEPVNIKRSSDEYEDGQGNPGLSEDVPVNEDDPIVKSALEMFNGTVAARRSDKGKSK